MRARWCLLAAWVASCAIPQRFVPAGDVDRSSVDPSAGVVSEGGVTVVADTERWSADPAALARIMTPIHVRVLNHSDRDLAIRYQSFVLRTDHGRELRPIPPIAIDLEEPPRPRRAPSPDASAFHFAPYYREVFGEQVRYWTGGFSFDPYFYDELEWGPRLPTDAMVARGLPEGVLTPGGWISGFLYFDRVEPEAEHLTLHVDFDLPQGEERIATIDIAFVDVS